MFALLLIFAPVLFLTIAYFFWNDFEKIDVIGVWVIFIINVIVEVVFYG